MVTFSVEDVQDMVEKVLIEAGMLKPPKLIFCIGISVPGSRG